eukprot:CAMPEP_0114242808 /NCGR_PEP_ID=MMETSP0058-20121206/10392_1 /TAXON_ID=36894 /ORGANISM="Pyramimonas parkeae, CCMP726" /LENGTH=109 /DNA_ID=CAMNT_0001355483 /DNA_START=407 /DNA_END=736 /DNA_ORIENTATION=-
MNAATNAAARLTMQVHTPGVFSIAQQRMRHSKSNSKRCNIETVCQASKADSPSDINESTTKESQPRSRGRQPPTAEQWRELRRLTREAPSRKEYVHSPIAQALSGFEGH